ncbi:MULTISPECIES: acylphosphatase [Bacillaceae]|uniref:Acylphosphatase n=1 Tax=Evansella alkalicola TaxID=745819 RepID=A0ABS6JYP8_9BACI|nr:MULTISPECIES: acylphosphatase [Bacillaceae]MBU9723618.1 acylphosphatase [Bacillus alkalicola]
METKRFIVYGKVQGVGFRKFTRKHARLNNIVGWVRNNPDGTVEILGRGSASNMHNFIEKIKNGPKKAIIKDLKFISHTSKTSLKEFIILYNSK